MPAAAMAHALIPAETAPSVVSPAPPFGRRVLGAPAPNGADKTARAVGRGPRPGGAAPRSRRTR